MNVKKEILTKEEVKAAFNTMMDRFDNEEVFEVEKYVDYIEVALLDY